MSNLVKGIIITVVAIPLSIIGVGTIDKFIKLRSNKKSKKNTKKNNKKVANKATKRK